MLTPNALDTYCERLRLSDQAREQIDAIRSSEPVRRVHGRGNNVCARYPSQKMGRVVQAESRTVELAAIRCAYEFDDDVLEYWDQPCQIKLDYIAHSGRRVAPLHTPDFFVLRRQSVEWNEWKPADVLPGLAEKMPNRYQQYGGDGDGGDGDSNGGIWHCPPGEAYAAQFGFGYRVRTSSEFSAPLQRNIAFLEDYLRANASADVCSDANPGAGYVHASAHMPAPMDEAAQRAILHAVRSTLGITLAQLLSQWDGDCIYSLIAAHDLYVDLNAFVLAETERVPVFADAVTASACAIVSQSHSQSHSGALAQSSGARRCGTDMAADPSPSGLVNVSSLASGTMVLWDHRPWQIVNAGVTHIALMPDEHSSQAGGQVIEMPLEELARLCNTGSITLTPKVELQAALSMSEQAARLVRQASPQDLRRANERHAWVTALLAGDTPQTGRSARTLREYKRRYRDAEMAFGCGYLGLLDANARKGNHTPRLQPESADLIERFIEQSYETLKQKSIRQVYGEYLLACADQQLDPASYTTFARRVHARPMAEQVRQRQGRRSAYRHEAQANTCTWWLDYATPRHGDYPWQVIHIDHTQLNLELVCAQTGRNLGRPWLTTMVDAFCRRIPALYLTFDPPSYRSCMAVMVECVRRHGRLPESVVLDGGREFGSVYVETLLAHCRITKLSRPDASPRFGSLIERLFRTSETEFIHNLRGNTQMMKLVHTRQVTKDVNPKHLAVWTCGALHAHLCAWAYEVYDQMPHATLGQSPREAFLTGLANGGSRAGRRVEFDEAFRMLSLPSTRTGRAKIVPGRGVKIHYLYYWCDAFRGRLAECTHVPVRFDPFDLGIAYAFVGGLWQLCICEHYALFRGHSERELWLATAALRRQKQLHHAHQNFTASAQMLATFMASAEAEEVLLEQQLRDNESRQARDATLAFTPPPELPMAQAASSSLVAARTSSPIASSGNAPAAIETESKRIVRIRQSDLDTYAGFSI